MATRSNWVHTRWPTRHPDRAAAAFDELAEAFRPGTDRDWMASARCRESGDDLHFPTAEPGSQAFTVQVSAAKQECHACPVRAECLAYALETAEPHGIWGGTTPAERRRLATRPARRPAAGTPSLAPSTTRTA